MPVASYYGFTRRETDFRFLAICKEFDRTDNMLLSLTKPNSICLIINMIYCHLRSYSLQLEEKLKSIYLGVRDALWETISSAIINVCSAIINVVQYFS